MPKVVGTQIRSPIRKFGDIQKFIPNPFCDLRTCLRTKTSTEAAKHNVSLYKQRLKCFGCLSLQLCQQAKKFHIVKKRNKQRSRVGCNVFDPHTSKAKLQTECGTTPPLARKLHQRFADFICLALGDFYTVKLYNVQYNNKYRPPQSAQIYKGPNQNVNGRIKRWSHGLYNKLKPLLTHSRPLALSRALVTYSRNVPADPLPPEPERFCGRREVLYLTPHPHPQHLAEGLPDRVIFNC